MTDIIILLYIMRGRSVLIEKHLIVRVWRLEDWFLKRDKSFVRIKTFECEIIDDQISWCTYAYCPSSFDRLSWLLIRFWSDRFYYNSIPIQLVYDGMYRRPNNKNGRRGVDLDYVSDFRKTRWGLGTLWNHFVISYTVIQCNAV